MSPVMVEENLVAKINTVIKDVLKVDENRLQPQSRLKEDLGADSLDRVSLLMALEDEFQADISDSDAEKLVTLSDVHQYILLRSKSAGQ